MAKGFAKPDDSIFSSSGSEGSVGEDVVGGRTPVNIQEGGPDVRKTYVPPAGKGNATPAMPGA